MGREIYAENSDESSDEFFANPIRLTVKPFLVEAILRDGASIAPGEPVLELSFTRSLHHFERRRDAVRAFLGEIAYDMEDDQFNGVHLPEHITGYTFKRLATFAERVFGFTQAALTLPSIPEICASDPLNSELGTVFENIRQNSNGRGEPTVIHMLTSDFIAHYAQTET